MERLFREFLQKQGMYEVFTNSVLKFYKCSLQHYCRENRISKYCQPINRSPLMTGSEAKKLNDKWVVCWTGKKQELLLGFLCTNGLLFSFIESLKQGVTLTTLCSDTHSINDVFHVTHQKNSGAFPCHKIGKEWKKYLKEKVFTFN